MVDEVLNNDVIIYKILSFGGFHLVNI